jgi:hypothetical protein
MKKLSIVISHKAPANKLHSWFKDEFILELSNLASIHEFYLDKDEDLIQYNESIVEFIRSNTTDLFISVLGLDNVFKETLLQINRFTKTLFFANDSYTIRLSYKNVAKIYSSIWLTHRGAYKYFKKFNAKPIELPYGCITRNIYRKKEKIIRKVLFVGNPYGSRILIINHLLLNKIPVVIYNSELKNHNQYNLYRSILNSILIS